MFKKVFGKVVEPLSSAVRGSFPPARAAKFVSLAVAAGSFASAGFYVKGKIDQKKLQLVESKNAHLERILWDYIRKEENLKNAGIQAIWANNENEIKDLLNKGVDPTSLLPYALSNLRITKLLLENGADGRNVLCTYWMRSTDGYTDGIPFQKVNGLADGVIDLVTDYVERAREKQAQADINASIKPKDGVVASL